MTKHSLNLEVLETACETVLKISDSSVYSSAIPVECARLDITVPGYTQPVYIYDDPIGTLPQGFNKVLTGSDLLLQVGISETPCILPDGIYTIQYSVAPNDKVYVKYYHLRTTTLVNEYYAELCKLELKPCEPTAEQKQKIGDLRYIKILIDAAKSKVEYCHANSQGTDMYNYAYKLLRKYKTGCCITCNY